MIFDSCTAKKLTSKSRKIIRSEQMPGNGNSISLTSDVGLSRHKKSKGQLIAFWQSTCIKMPSTSEETAYLCFWKRIKTNKSFWSGSGPAGKELLSHLS